ncbi:Uncharacterized protein GBIM_06572 [Gryllus bimaculatus]|nr:Uncharacterized protein GBIM_06572 [Gryllus bimaculatus]
MCVFYLFCIASYNLLACENIDPFKFLLQIVETMSYTDNVASFLGSLGSFYDHVPAEDLELLVGPVIERLRSQPGSPLGGSPFEILANAELKKNLKPTRVSGISFTKQFLSVECTFNTK